MKLPPGKMWSSSTISLEIIGYEINETFLFTALLSGTLKTYQRAVCDEETMTLKCPPGTTISIALAQYGRSASNGTDRCNTAEQTLDSGDRQINQTCLWPKALQVRVNTSPKSVRCFHSNWVSRVEFMNKTRTIEIIVKISSAA